MIFQFTVNKEFIFSTHFFLVYIRTFHSQAEISAWLGKYYLQQDLDLKKLKLHIFVVKFQVS